MSHVRFFCLSLCMSLTTAFAQTGFQQHSYPVPGAGPMIVADFNHDGSPDVFLFSGASILFNDGHGGFSTPNPLPITDSISNAAIGDFNGDGSPDISACLFNSSNETSSFEILLNDGTGGFHVSYSIPLVNGSCNGIAVGDANKDGKQDVVLTSSSFSGNSSINIIRTYFGDGKGKLASSPVTQQGFSVNGITNHSLNNCFVGGAVGGDVNHDGILDLVLLGNCAGVASGGTLYLAKGDGTGHYALSEIAESDISYTLPTLTDINGDGKLDLIVTGNETLVTSNHIWYLQNNYVLFAINDGTGKFAFKTVFKESFTPADNFSNLINAAAAADLNGDGIPDAIIGVAEKSSTSNPGGLPMIVILNGTSNGGFVESQRWNIAGFPAPIVARDLNKDGKPDLAVLQTVYNTQQSSLLVYLNQMSAGNCVAPSSPGVHVCAPIAGQTYSSPVQFTATGTGASGSVNHMELWIDGKKINNYAGNQLRTSVALGSGSHTGTAIEVDSKGAFIKSSPIPFNVK